VVLVSAALGPVGSMVGQLAIQRGAHAVGIAGSDEKCAFVRDLGFSACINYRSADFLPTLAAALPDGADIYHDNVGGQMLADAFTVLKNYGTVILCGLMERYNDPALSKPLDLALPIIKRAVMKGLVVTDFEHCRAQFVDFVAPRIADGRIRYREDRANGIAATGAHFARLMRGENLGKAVVALADESVQS
jgi:NADPH-dependent curcumin reductase CurA